MIINLCFTYLGLKFIGPDGAAYASVAYHICSLLLIYGVLKRQVKIEMRNIAGYVIYNYTHLFSLAKKFVSRFQGQGT
jgi:hypothetical protein